MPRKGETKAESKRKAEELRLRVGQLKAEGYLQDEIAKMCRVSQPQVSKILAEYKKEARKQLVGRAVDEIVGQLDALDYQEKECHREWRRSKDPKRREARKTGGDSGLDRVDTIEAIDQMGNVAYFHAARAAMADKRQLLGLNIGEAQQGVAGISTVSQDIVERARDHEAEKANGHTANSGGSSPGNSGGTQSVQDRPEQVQPDDTMP